MNSFARTMIYGLAALCVVFIAGVVTSVAVLRSKGVLEPSVLRALVLSKQERDWLDALHTRGPEKPVARSTRGASEEEVLERIAEMANADRATRLVSDIKLQKQGLDERQTELERQWSEYRLARTDLERLQSQLEARQARIVAEKNDQAGEQARWAAAQLSESNWIAQLGVAEKARYADQAKLFEQMKDQAWASLRRFEPREIARYLALMDAKKAARVLVAAEQDPEYGDLTPVIHREMLRLDLSGQSPDQSQRLATLYSFMPAEAVLPYLRDASAQEVAEIMIAMETGGQEKKRAQLLEALRADNSNRELEVRRLLNEARPQTAQAEGPR